MTALPPLATGRRRPLLASLLGVAVLHAGLAVATAVLAGRLVATGPGVPHLLLVAAGGCVLGIGVTRYAERVLAERLGQDYVHELRVLLVRGALTDDGSPSLGITIARTTNDLTAVRTWVAQGIAPIVAGVPLVAGSVLMLGLLHWSLAVATLVPLLLLGATLLVAGRIAYRRARLLRRRRGRLAARVSDTLHARHAIRTAGGEHRELGRLDEESRRVVSAAVARARVAAVMQAASMTTAAAIAVLVAVAGRLGAVSPGAVATGLTVAGVLASPLAEAGRIVQFRQNFRAARRILAPRIAATSAASQAGDPGRPRYHARSGAGALHVEASGLALHARPGDRVRLVGREASRVSGLLRRIASPEGRDQHVVVDGWDACDLAPTDRRELVGLASRGTPVERGTVARAVRYRRPDLPSEEGTAALRQVGLHAVVARLPRGERTELRRGGEPLGAPDLARLQVARAALGTPPVLLLDHVDADLDPTGVEMLRGVVSDYPGVVVFASDRPDRVSKDHRTVHLP